MITAGDTGISKIVAVSNEGTVLPPCGRCRKFMYFFYFNIFEISIGVNHGQQDKNGNNIANYFFNEPE